MSGISLDWFWMIPCEIANSSLIVPSPLGLAIAVAKPTRNCVFLNVFQSAGVKLFFVTIFLVDAGEGWGTSFSEGEFRAPVTLVTHRMADGGETEYFVTGVRTLGR